MNVLNKNCNFFYKYDVKYLVNRVLIKNYSDNKNYQYKDQLEKLKFNVDNKLVLARNQNKFLDIIYKYKKNSTEEPRLGQCEFIEGCLKVLKTLDLHKEVDVYKQLMDVFPKDKMITQNRIQQLSFLYPKHQITAINIFDKMNEHNVFPDKEMQDLTIRIFGLSSFAARKVFSMNYWNSKLSKQSPFPFPEFDLEDKFQLSLLALKRMCVDTETKIHRYETSIITDEKENEWILSAQSPNQKKLIEKLNEIVYIEGPFFTFMKENVIKYFCMKTHTNYPFKLIEEERPLDVSRLKIKVFGKKDVLDIKQEKLNLHCQEDGAILGLCITERSTDFSILSWTRIMSKLDNNLERLQIVFNINKEV